MQELAYVRPDFGSDQPLVDAVLAAPLEHSFAVGDQYLLCVGGEPIRILRVGAVLAGPHPPEATFSCVWMPTVEQVALEILQSSERAYVEFDNVEGGVMGWSGFENGVLGRDLRSAAHNLLVAHRAAR